MINILHLRDTNNVCGPGKTILETCARIDKDRFNLSIGLFMHETDKENLYYKEAKDRGLTIYPIRTNHQFDKSIIKKIIQIIKEKDIHIIHSHEYKSDIVALLVSRFHKIPIMTTCHGWITNSLKSKLYIWLGKQTLRYFDRVISVSPLIHKEVLRVGAKPENNRLIYNAIVMENYRPGNYENHYLRRKYNLPDEAIIIGNAGRLSPEKGQQEFIYAANEITKDYPNTYFFIMGDGPDRPRLEKMVAQLQLTEKVYFLGHIKDMRSIYQDMDFFTLTSYTEGFPNVLLEALCMDTPCIATDVGGVSEIIQNDITGKLKFYLDYPEKAREFAASGKQLVVDRYQIKDRIEKVQVLYEEVML